MMVGFLFAALGFAALFAVVAISSSTDTQVAVLRPYLIVGYLARIVTCTFLRELPLFQHGNGGDYLNYEIIGTWVAKIWLHDIHWVTNAEIGYMGPTTLPPNVFAVPTYMNNGTPSVMAQTAIVALLACWSVLLLYELAIFLGADRVYSRKIATLLLFSPAFFMYTSDSYKEGFALFFVILCASRSFKLARQFSIRDILIACIAIVGLLGVRFYLVFLCLAPFAVGIAGSRRSFVGTVIVSVICIVGMAAIVAYSESGRNAADAAFSAGELAATKGMGKVDARYLGVNSFVVFEDGGNPLNSLGPKLVYTLFAPFPWQGGSMGMQIGKIEAAIWYYLLYRQWVAGRRLLKEDRVLLVMFIVFLVPLTLMYAMMMYNIGLIVRERMPIILVGGLFAMLSVPAAKAIAKVDEEAGTADEPLAPKFRRRPLSALHPRIPDKA